MLKKDIEDTSQKAQSEDTKITATIEKMNKTKKSNHILEVENTKLEKLLEEELRMRGLNRY